MISFRPFRELIEKRKISTYFLRNKCGNYNLDSKTIDRLMNDESVSTHTINALCHIFGCGFADIMEFALDDIDKKELEEETIDSSDAGWEEYDKFMDDYKSLRKNNKTFPELVKSIMDEKGYSIKDVSDKANLSPQTINRFRSGKIKNRYKEMVEYVPHYNSIIAFSIACNIDVPMTLQLFETRGLGLDRTNKLHCAYWHIIATCRGKTIEECNEILEKLKVDENDLLGEKFVANKQKSNQ